MAVTDANEAPSVEFRFSPQRFVMEALGTLLIVGAAPVAVSVAVGPRWWDALPIFAAAFVASLLQFRWRNRRQPLRLPLRLSGEGLAVTASDGNTLTADWSNVTRAYIHGRWLPYLVVKLVDPDRTRPPLPLPQEARRQPFRPSEFAVSLAYMTPDRDVLRQELARRLPTAAG